MLLNHGDAGSGLFRDPLLGTAQRQLNADDRVAQVVEPALADFPHTQHRLKATLRLCAHFILAFLI